MAFPAEVEALIVKLDLRNRPEFKAALNAETSSITEVLNALKASGPANKITEKLAEKLKEFEGEIAVIQQQMIALTQTYNTILEKPAISDQEKAEKQETLAKTVAEINTLTLAIARYDAFETQVNVLRAELPKTILGENNEDYTILVDPKKIYEELDAFKKENPNNKEIQNLQLIRVDCRNKEELRAGYSEQIQAFFKDKNFPIHALVTMPRIPELLVKQFIQRLVDKEMITPVRSEAVDKAANKAGTSPKPSTKKRAHEKDNEQQGNRTTPTLAPGGSPKGG